ncbi:MAG: diguanylate phosphodiesterase [Betaproteobacteria bacterium HGW-Betaproteobacteria-7]|jgi:diguanylate cyclase (GGDEF)-like protein/PAS domain S-box-containing protein|nr:MAG: diguanylate phosphodiesterase [Betaproteobacteria bacterium HGW-Betaproteobacteria-7]
MSERDTDGRPTNRPVVLAVDDVPDNLTTIADMLRELDVSVRVASNGPTALRYAALEPRPDLILLDVMMPGMDGHAVLAELRSRSETRDIPVIFVTALDSASDEQAGLLEGAADYISKPIKPAVLTARVQAQLELKLARDRHANQREWLEGEVKRRVAENAALETRLQLALSSVHLGIWELDHASGATVWSDTLRELFGLTQAPADLAGFLAMVHPEDRSLVEERVAGLSRPSDDVHVEEFRVRHADGSWRWIEGRGRALGRDANGVALTSVGTMIDISRRKHAEMERLLSSAVFTNINDGVCITDQDSHILMTNEAFTRLTGYGADEVRGQTPALLKSGAHGPAFYSAMWEAISHNGSWQGEITNRRKDGELITEWLSISAVNDRDGRLTHYIGIFSDLSERKAAAERIQYLSSYDPLTNLPNRNLFADRLAQSLLAAQRFNRQTAVILLDLDRFRTVNEGFGPPAGDEALREVVRRLNLQVRDGDTIGRRSGNEFGFVMANLGQEHDAIALAQRMLEAIAQPLVIAGQTIALTASVGICVSPRDGSTADGLLKSADSALSRAKQAGRNTFRFYSPEMDADAARRLGLESALRNALANDEMTVYYQPQISLESGNMVGMEALLRWNNAQFGAVSPVEFIPIAEETGLILTIGEWVLRQACLQTRRWLDLGLLPLRVAVNLSARQFRQSNLVRMVGQTLADTGLAAAALELEITESAFIDDVDEAIATCRALKKLGVRLSLDDFGTGYSSLAYISRFPFDKLKIDQGFVRDIIENPVNAAIATAAIVMGRSLNLSVLAEGVETEAQASFLRGRRCDAMQGYLFSRPLPAAEFEQLLAGESRLVIPAIPADPGQTLLLVDDEPNILNSLSRLLRREAYQILTATSPLEAFEVLAKHPVQVILSDQRMPEMSGTEFFSRVRQLYPDTIRIVLTGYTDLDSVTGAINRGAIYKFLTKPWDDDLLREQVREAFRVAKERRQQAMDPASP